MELTRYSDVDVMCGKRVRVSAFFTLQWMVGRSLGKRYRESFGYNKNLKEIEKCTEKESSHICFTTSSVNWILQPEYKAKCGCGTWVEDNIYTKIYWKAFILSFWMKPFQHMNQRTIEKDTKKVLSVGYFVDFPFMLPPSRHTTKKYFSLVHLHLYRVGHSKSLGKDLLLFFPTIIFPQLAWF